MEEDKACPCKSGEIYKNCCGPFHSGREVPDSPEKLMRSRYCAYVLKEIEYLFNTTLPLLRSKKVKETMKTWAEAATFLNLEVINTKDAQADDKTGIVEFKATYVLNEDKNKEQRIHHELSKFERQQNRWFFVKGKTF